MRFIESFVFLSSFAIIGLYFACLHPTEVVAKGKSQAVQDLKFPDEAESVETIEPSVFGIDVIKDAILSIVDTRAFIIKTPLKGLTGKRVENFGEITDSKRMELKLAQSEVHWRGISSADGKVLLLDGHNLSVTTVSPDLSGVLSFHGIVWDKIKPPRDKGGEPTRVETERLRKAFKNAMNSAPLPKLVGMAPVSADWAQGSEKEFHYLVATRITGFPLVAMACTADDPSRCRLTRACFVEDKQLGATDVIGIGVLQKEKIVVLGNHKNHELRKYRFNSCFHIVPKGRVFLPAKMKPATSLTIDSESRLWVASIRPDDYLNASIYTWKAGTW